MQNCITFLLICATLGTVAAAPRDFFVYFGTYSKNRSHGIYRARFDAATGRLGAAELAIEAKDASFLALHPNRKILYAVDESSDPQRTPNTGVSAYAIAAKTGALTLLNQQTVGGAGPCHVNVDREGLCVFVANYGSGSIESIALESDGRLGAVGTSIQHAGSSVNPARQSGPHAHSIYAAPGNRFVLAADLGLDRVFVYRLDSAAAKLTANDPAFAALPPGSGPRHLAFHPNGKFVYVINEMLCTVAVFGYDAARGALTELQTISTLSPGQRVEAGVSTAEIAVHPSGRFLYGSNRGQNSIAVFALDPATGRLALLETHSTRGSTPRHFALDPTGAWLLAENQDSGDVAIFRIDGATGRLTASGGMVAVPTPVCAVFVPAP